jgi:hypothetical protein
LENRRYDDVGWCCLIIPDFIVCDDTLSPKWKPFPLFFDMIPGGLAGRLLVESYDWDPDGSFDFIGEFRCTLQEFIDAKKKHYFINPKKKK